MSISSDTPRLNTVGHFVSGALTSFCNISVCHPLFTLKTFAMAGRGLPKPSQLYAGYKVNLGCDISNQAVAFGAYGIFQQVIMNHKELSPFEDLLGGLFAGTTAAPLLSML
jgi:hypothetical protein